MNNWIVEASPVSAQPSRVTTAVFVLLLLVPMAGTVLYGAVDAAVLGLASVLVGIVAVLWLVHAWSIGELRFSTSAIQLPIIAIIAIGLVQLLPFGGHGVSGGELTSVGVTRSLTLDPFATRLFIAQLTVFLVFLAAALVFFDSPSRVKRSAVAIVIFASVMAFFGILQKLSDPEAIYGLRPTPQAIPFGPLVNQHHFAAFMEMSSGLTLALIFGAGLKRDRKLLLWIAAVVMGIALVFTGSRGGVISYAGVVLFVISASYLFTSRTKEPADDHRANRLSLIAGATALALIIAGLAFYLGGGDSLMRGIGVGTTQATDVSSGRLRFWSVALQIFAANPVLGSGLDSFAVAFTRFDTESGIFRVEQAHNEYLQTLAEAGIIGLLCVLAFVYLLFRNGLRVIASARDNVLRSIAIGALAGCFGIVIHSFFDFPLRTPSNAFFFLMLSALAVCPVIAESRGRK